MRHSSRTDPTKGENEFQGCHGAARAAGSLSVGDDDRALLEGHCHCGAVRLRLPDKPEKATRCNCSLCRRLGAVWAYYAVGSVEIEGHPQYTEAYIQGDRTLRTIRCKACGCITHWEPLDASLHPNQGINLNNFEPALLEQVRVRRFDGADTWQFID